jgi:hypothetical protein
MAFSVREECLEEVRDAALATLAATRQSTVTAARYDWLYRDNPDGQAVLWSIRSAESGDFAGFTVALPRRVLVDGKQHLCWNGADFSVRQKYRTLGVAIQLRRAARNAVDTGRADFLYAHPNRKMQIVHEKAGHVAVGTMVRYAKVLRSAPYYRRYLPGQWMPAVAGTITDWTAHGTRTLKRHRQLSATRVIQCDAFDDRFDRLFEDAHRVRRVIGVRDARYLTWRYACNPLYRTSAVVSEDNGRLLGYALFKVTDGVVSILDVFASPILPVERDLVNRLINHALELHLTSVTMVMLEGHPMEQVLADFGFMRRPDSSQMFGYAPQHSAWKNTVLARESWYASVGDRDV